MIWLTLSTDEEPRGRGVAVRPRADKIGKREWAVRPVLSDVGVALGPQTREDRVWGPDPTSGVILSPPQPGAAVPHATVVVAVPAGSNRLAWSTARPMRSGIPSWWKSRAASSHATRSVGTATPCVSAATGLTIGTVSGAGFGREYRPRRNETPAISTAAAASDSARRQERLRRPRTNTATESARTSSRNPDRGGPPDRPRSNNLSQSSLFTTTPLEQLDYAESCTCLYTCANRSRALRRRDSIASILIPFAAAISFMVSRLRYLDSKARR
jgi:hypothetical protein